MTPEPTGPKQDGRWRPGESGNPAGRPRGTKNKVTLAAEALLDGEAEAITRKAVELAKAGDLAAIRICMDRIIPARRDHHVTFELPKIETSADAVKACSALLEAVADGDLTPSEAAELGKLVDACLRSIEATEFEERLSRLERGAAK
jgi:Family of unknown function (DUF5681)